MSKGSFMEKLLGIAWLFATLISWISFSVASWFWADDISNSGMFVLTILWFVMSLFLFLVGLRYRKPSS
jgi:hypothetical protein